MKPMSSGLYIAAPWRSSGKTTVSVGLARAAYNRGINVQAYKKGPDYIDPQWLALASKQACYNLDPHLQTPTEYARTFSQNLKQGHFALVEGAHGLHDGLMEDGSDSNAEIAKRLGLPVVLTFDCRGMNRTLAALVNGLQAFDTDVAYAGIVLNRVKSDRHLRKVEAVLKQYTDFTVLGALPESANLSLAEKELGLVPALECKNSEAVVENAAKLLEQHCDLNALFDSSQEQEQVIKEFNVAEHEPASLNKQHSNLKPSQSQYPLRIGLAQDEAFHFYYQDDMDELRSRGVEIVPVSPIHDPFPTNLDGLIMGGGFPERFVEALSSNVQFRQGLQSAVSQGLAVHAECAGLMYLCRSIHHNGTQYPMSDCLNADVELLDRPVGRGYMRLKTCNPIKVRRPSESNVAQTHDPILGAHEFHHSRVVFDAIPDFIYHVERGFGIDGKHDGVRMNNVHATYAHFRHTANTPWVDWLLERIVNQAH